MALMPITLMVIMVLQAIIRLIIPIRVPMPGAQRPMAPTGLPVPAEPITPIRAPWPGAARYPPLMAQGVQARHITPIQELPDLPVRARGPTDRRAPLFTRMVTVRLH